MQLPIIQSVKLATAAVRKDRQNEEQCKAGGKEPSRTQVSGMYSGVWETLLESPKESHGSRQKTKNHNT